MTRSHACRTAAARRAALLPLLACLFALLGATDSRAQARGERGNDRYSLATTLVVEGKHEGNYDLDREDRENTNEIEPLLRLGLRLWPGRAWSGFVETEWVHNSERQTGEPTRNRTRILLNQAYVASEGLLPHTRLRLGRWLQRDEREWLFDENLDGLHAGFERGRWSGEAFVARAHRWQRDLLDSRRGRDNAELNGLIARREFKGDLDAAAYVLWHRDRDSGDRRRHAGLRASLMPDKGGLDARAELAFVHGREEGTRLRGHAWDFGLGYTFAGLPLRPRIELGQAYASEHHRQTGMQSNEGPRGPDGIGKFSLYGEAADPEMRNLRVTSLGLGLHPDPRSSIDLVWHHYRQPVIAAFEHAEFDPRGDRLDSAHLGDEFDLLVGWRPRDDLRLEVVLGWFRPGARLRADDEADSPRAGGARFARAELTWRF